MVASQPGTYFGSDAPAPRSAYVHVPFCRHRCGYCNFSLVAGRDHLIDRFLGALAIEVARVEEPMVLDTLFFGGGTPSHLNPEQLARLKAILATRFQWTAAAEVTAECNPNDLTPQRVAALRQLGVNRISLGVQSLNPEKLRQLDRDHSSADVRNAVGLAREQIGAVSMDLIFAAPNETLSQWQQDLGMACELQPDHLSTYELTYEKGTQFWNRQRRGELTVLEEDLRAEMYEWTIGYLADHGLDQYELSSFAKPDQACRHNRVYWTGAPYFAFGPAASRLIDGVRSTNHRSPMRYMQLLEAGEDPTAESEQLTGIDAARERLAVGLRLISGVCCTTFHRQTSCTIEDVLGEKLEWLTGHQLLEFTETHCRLTRRGVMVSDGIATAILSP